MDNDLLNGLSSDEVAQRKSEGKTNVSSTIKTKSIRRIFYDNICTLFNAINVILFLLLILVGSYKNLLFIGVIIFNTIIGIVQEIRSKISVDKLTILTESKSAVIRDGKETEIGKEELVLDDVIVLSRGDQIPADCVLISGECKANESMLTGESDLIEKNVGDELLSGSFVSAGKCVAKIIRIGADCYAAKINSEAKYIKKNNSQILKTFKFIIKLCTFIIFPLGALLFVSRYFIHHTEFQESVISTVGALVGILPSGMILLTSTVLAVSVIKLSRKKVLVNEMYCIETLARVDVLCLDKTGTLTSENMSVTDVIEFNNSEEEIKIALSSIFSASEDKNATMNAIGGYAGDAQPINCKSFIEFSSETKWSGGNFDNGKSYIVGACEFVFNDREKYSEVFERFNQISDTVRVLALVSSDSAIESGKLPSDLEPMALILIKDILRDNVGETINYFKEQGVTLKVISGDSVQTVLNIAKDCGIEGAEKAVDMTEVKTDEQLAEAAENCNVFGRVTPEQKKKLVLALKAKGHKVAMTGDGVNDVLALKEADCSISMASGSEAARNVSQLVLTDNDFASMPSVVYEGRKTINNIERSSSLFIVKAIYSILLSLFFIFCTMPYPFEPIQLTLISSLTIGFPSFVLALQPNKDIVRGNFTFNILARAIPAAFCVVVNIIIAVIMCSVLNIPYAEFSTISVYLTALTGYLFIIRLSLPLNYLRSAMLLISAAGFSIAFIFLDEFFSLTTLSVQSTILFVSISAAIIIIFNILYNIAVKLIEKDKNQC